MLRLARLDVFEPDVLVMCPALDRRADVLGAVVAPYDLRPAPPGNDLPRGSDHTLWGQREIDLDTQGFAVEVINDVEQSEAPAILELVVHELHGPDLVDGFRHPQRFRFALTSRLRRLCAGSALAPGRTCRCACGSIGSP